MAPNKQQLAKLATIFPSTHEIFQISSNQEELSCRFIGKGGKKHEITVHIPDNYPREPPLWFSESEDPTVVQALEALTCNEESELNNQNHNSNSLISQIGAVIRNLCKAQKLTEPIADLEKLEQILESDNEEKSPNKAGGTPDSDTDNESLDLQNDGDGEEDEDIDMDMDLALEENTTATGSDKPTEEDDDLSPEELEILERQRRKVKTYGTDSNSTTRTGSFLASDRLMKELRNIYKSTTFKNGLYKTELVKDNLYEWKVNLKSSSFDKDSLLYSDLLRLKQNGGVDEVLLSFTFKNNFPFSPPFVRILKPLISGGHVTIGGAVCMELLTTDGWSSAYTVEAVIVQVAATLVAGKGRAVNGPTESRYTLANAKDSYDRMLRTHAAVGWGTAPN